MIPDELVARVTEVGQAKLEALYAEHELGQAPRQTRGLTRVVLQAALDLEYELRIFFDSPTQPGLPDPSSASPKRREPTSSKPRVPTPSPPAPPRKKLLVKRRQPKAGENQRVQLAAAVEACAEYLEERPGEIVRAKELTRVASRHGLKTNSYYFRALVDGLEKRLGNRFVRVKGPLGRTSGYLLEGELGIVWPHQEKRNPRYSPPPPKPQTPAEARALERFASKYRGKAPTDFDVKHPAWQDWERFLAEAEGKEVA